MASIRPDHEWTRVYCSTQEEADRLVTDLSFVAPLVATSFERAVAEGRGSCVILEVVPSDAYHPTYVTARRTEMASWVERCIAALVAADDFEECARLSRVLRELERSVTSASLSA